MKRDLFQNGAINSSDDLRSSDECKITGGLIYEVC